MNAKDLLIQELKAQLQQRDALLRANASLLQEKESLLQEKDSLLHDQQSRLQLQSSELREKDEHLQRTQAELVETQAQQAATSEQFTLTLREKQDEINKLRREIKRLLSAVRGSRQERINPDQLLLFSAEELQELADELERAKQDEAEPQPAADDPGKPSKSGRKRGGRQRLPENLPREIARHELSEEERRCPCCGELRAEIDVEKSEQLEFVPASWKVIEHQRVKYACTSCQENVALAVKPPQPIEKGLPGPGLCAFTVLSKFGDHLPLYREEDMHSRTGRMIRRSTICGWLSELGKLTDALVLRMAWLILQSKVIHTDDTKIKMLAPGICQECKFWPYLGDWMHRYVVYDFTLDRTRNGPMNFLQGYQGYLQADAFSGFDGVYASGPVLESACWIHARRYWHEAIDNDELRANVALGFIARLSQIESQLRRAYPEMNLQGARDFESIAAARRQHSLPILTEFKAWMERELNTGRILPKSDLRSAFTYTQNQWTALCRYTEQGYLSMDNNAAERMVKYPAIGRRNYLFVGNERAGRNAGNFYSLVISAKLNGVEPFAWLKDVFTRLPYHRQGEAFRQARAGQRVTSDELDYLLPDRWLAEHPGHAWTIDAIRREERNQKERNPRRQRRSL